jgi:hypothetical protein
VTRVLAAALLAVASACSPDEEPLIAPTYENIVGTYALYLVNGGSIPFLAAADGVQRVEIVSGSITMNADRTISDVLTFRVSRVDGTGTPTEIPETRTGTFSIEGGFVFAAYEGEAEPTRITVTNSQLTNSVSSFVLSYRK